MDTSNKSEVAQLRERIAQEYQAANRVFTDFTPNARHEFIVKRQENIAACFVELQHHISPEEAMELIIEVGDQIHRSSASSSKSL